MHVHYPQFSLKWSWFLWLIWTAMLCYLLLWPSEGTAIRQISLFFGGEDITDAFGHLILVFVETNLVYSLLIHYFPQPRAMLYSLCGTLVFAFMLETAQYYIPGRGAALIDFVANASGVGLFILVFRGLKRLTLSL
jgi:hypothetical protein